MKGEATVNGMERYGSPEPGDSLACGHRLARKGSGERKAAMNEQTALSGKKLRAEKQP